jgi:ABC-type amino acid transport substrate-binding protein
LLYLRQHVRHGLQYGYKLENGSWTGIVGDLISGEIDISVATLTMTTEREEVKHC